MFRKLLNKGKCLVGAHTGNWTYVAVKQIHICARCEQRKAAGTAREFTSWVYGERDSCTQTQACSRCGAAVDTRDLMARMTTFMAGNNPQQASRVANQQRIREALKTFHDPAKARDRDTLLLASWKPM